MLKTLSRAVMALTFVSAATIATAPEADAHRGHRGHHAGGIIAGTIIGLGVLGAYAASREPGYYRSCYPGRQRCEVVGQRCWHNRYGEHVCKDDVRCYRPTHCD